MKSETCPRCGQLIGLDSQGRYVKHCAPDSAPYPCSTSGRTARAWGASEHFGKGEQLSRITSEQVYEFVVSAMELHERTKRSAFTMHEIIVNAWVPGFELPEIATAETIRKSFARVRKALVEEAGLTVVSVTDAYFRLINSKRRFTVADAGKCLPRKANPAVGLLIVTEESDPRDQLVWRVSAGLEKPQTTTAPAAPAPAAAAEAEAAHLTIEQLAEREGVAVGTVYGWNSKGGGPRYIKVGKHVRYRMSDVLAWEESRLRQSGGSYVPA